MGRKRKRSTTTKSCSIEVDGSVFKNTKSHQIDKPKFDIDKSVRKNVTDRLAAPLLTHAKDTLESQHGGLENVYSKIILWANNTEENIRSRAVAIECYDRMVKSEISYIVTNLRLKDQMCNVLAKLFDDTSVDMKKTIVAAATSSKRKTLPHTTAMKKVNMKTFKKCGDNSIKRRKIVTDLKIPISLRTKRAVQTLDESKLIKSTKPMQSTSSSLPMFQRKGVKTKGNQSTDIDPMKNVTAVTPIKINTDLVDKPTRLYAELNNYKIPFLSASSGKY